MSDHYIHGSSTTERQRLALMNTLINQRCVDALRLTEEELVLDVGAGTGQFTRMMAKQLPRQSLIIAVEHNPDQVEAALQLADSDSDHCVIDFRIGDAVQLPLEANEAGKVDLAHCRFLLEHVANPLEVVKAMVAVVKPGGRVILLDDDHELIRFWPEPEGLAAAWKAYYRSYHQLGNDPLIGRKLVRLLHQAGARPSRIDQLFYGACSGSASFRGIVDNLLGVLEGARGVVLAAAEISAADYDTALENFRAFAELPDAALWYVINWAEGIV